MWYIICCQYVPYYIYLLCMLYVTIIYVHILLLLYVYICHIRCVWLLYLHGGVIIPLSECMLLLSVRRMRTLVILAVCSSVRVCSQARACPGETMGKSQLNQVLLHSHHPIILASRVILTCDQASTLHLPTRQVYQTEAGKRQVISLVSIIIIPSHGLHHRLLLFYVT